jgi:hypothetical protein
MPDLRFPCFDDALAPVARKVERIAFDWNRIAVPIKRARPLDLDS